MFYAAFKADCYWSIGKKLITFHCELIHLASYLQIGKKVLGCYFGFLKCALGFALLLKQVVEAIAVKFHNLDKAVFQASHAQRCTPTIRCQGGNISQVN